MKIQAIDVFDLYGDGTLVMRTVMEEPKEELQYAWHIMEGRKTLFKIPYQARPFTAWQMPYRGVWTVKAFARDHETKEKIKATVDFTADRSTSPGLKAKQKHHFLKEPPTVERISGPFHKMYLDQKFPKGAQYAWYVYRTDTQDPVIKRLYQDSPEYVCAIHDPGEYFVKVFVMVNGKKDSIKSETFQVKG